MTCPEPFSIGGRFLAHWSQWRSAGSVSSSDPHPAGPNPSGAGCQDEHSDAAKIEHGRPKRLICSICTQGGDQSSLHPDNGRVRPSNQWMRLRGTATLTWGRVPPAVSSRLPRPADGPTVRAGIAETVAVFAPLGWAMCERWHTEGTLCALRLAA